MVILPEIMSFHLLSLLWEEDERADDDGDGDDGDGDGDDDDDGGDDDDGEDAGDEEQPRKRVKASDWEQIGPAEGGPVDPKLIPSYGGHVDRGILKYRSRYMALTGWSITDAEVVSLATGTGLMHLHILPMSDRTACYIQYLLGSSLFTDKIGNIVPSRLWPLVKDARSSGKFAWSAAT
ncbi:hypothetical protein M9H77_08216 [Catharanthus roseus]|uniref:Uncharacterized protein n=1 Tax=Catharanthus roseus TaxID=4058 RepID=A0ACC0BX56_CATRO|nr:hypothetical protein M9H77_08216 [Catharanthus roseus]